MKKEESSTRKLNATKTKAAEKVQLLQDKLTNLNFSAPEFGQLEDEKFKLENDVSMLRENVETLTAQLEGRLAFNYSDPVRGFDRSRVKGLVAKLVTVKIPKYSTALEGKYIDHNTVHIFANKIIFVLGKLSFLFLTSSGGRWKTLSSCC